MLSFGTAGCNLGCRFCQNWDITKSPRDRHPGRRRPSPETIAARRQALGCRSVAFTYNDPVIFHEYAIDVAQACRDGGVKTVAVTAGYMTPSRAAEFYRHIDAANVDLKGFTEAFYHKVCAGRTCSRCWRRWTTSSTRHVRLVGDHDPAHPRPERLGRRNGRADRWVVEQLGPDVPCTSRPFTRTSACSTGRRRRRRPCGGPGEIAARRRALRLRGQRSRPRGRQSPSATRCGSG